MEDANPDEQFNADERESVDVSQADRQAESKNTDIADQLADITPSYGTGVHDQPGLSIGGRTMADRMEAFNQAGPILTGGDIDANWEQANAVGDESVGGTAPTPDMDVVDELGAAIGLEMDDRAYLRTNDILEERDDRRWELDPESAEDYDNRE
ncbi:MAG: hypothetical protein IGS50_14755 [Synechococcales cyanobacterium C42_A2020_086]|nr:hypothetical protein [Synechococcales cyanobacterium C42_A2020_086]